jgi:hypothetical protein
MNDITALTAVIASESLDTWPYHQTLATAATMSWTVSLPGFSRFGAVEAEDLGNIHNIVF